EILWELLCPVGRPESCSATAVSLTTLHAAVKGKRFRGRVTPPRAGLRRLASRGAGDPVASICPPGEPRRPRWDTGEHVLFPEAPPGVGCGVRGFCAGRRCRGVRRGQARGLHAAA